MHYKTIKDVHQVFLNAARHIKRGAQRGTTQVTLTTGDYAEVLTVLAQAKDAEAKKVPPKVVIVMDGGIIQNIVASEDIEVTVIDYDTDGAEAEDLTDVPQTDGNAPEIEQAHVFGSNVEVDQAEAERLSALDV